MSPITPAIENRADGTETQSVGVGITRVSSTASSSDGNMTSVSLSRLLSAEDVANDARWATMLRDSSSFDLLDQMAGEALSDDDAGLTLDLDDLLS